MNAECLFFTPIPKSVQSISVPKFARNVLLHWNPTCIGFLAERDDDPFDDER